MKTVGIELKWAVIFSIAFLCWILFEKTVDWHEKEAMQVWWLTFLFAPFAVLIYLLALREKRRRTYGGRMTFYQGFASGLLISVFVALLSYGIEYVASTIFTSENFEKISDSSVTNELVSNTKMNDILMITNDRWQSSFGLLGMGIVISLIAAFFVKRSAASEKETIREE